MDESRKAFDDWCHSISRRRAYSRLPETFETWQAAVEWARQDERERLAKLAHDRGFLREDEIRDIAKGWK